MAADNKVLVVYFSYSGITRSVAAQIATKLDARTTEIKPVRNGMVGMFFRTLFGLPATIQKMTANSGEYDLVVIATPVWSARVPSPVRAFLTTIPDQCEVAFVCTQNSEGAESVLRKMQNIAMKTPIDTLILSSTDFTEDGNADSLVTRFCSECRSTVATMQNMISHPVRSAPVGRTPPIPT